MGHEYAGRSVINRPYIGFSISSPDPVRGDPGEELLEEDIWSTEEDSEVFNDEDSPRPLKSRSSAQPDNAKRPVSVVQSPGVSQRSFGSAGVKGVGLLSVLVKNSQQEALHSTSGISSQFPDRHVETVNNSGVVIPAARPKADDIVQIPRRSSAPVNIPNWGRLAVKEEDKPEETVAAGEDDEGMVPPHVMMEREYAQSMRFSIRTLKGRDLDLVRTAILRKTGFIDT